MSVFLFQLFGLLGIGSWLEHNGHRATDLDRRLFGLLGTGSWLEHNVYTGSYWYRQSETLQCTTSTRACLMRCNNQSDLVPTPVDVSLSLGAHVLGQNDRRTGGALGQGGLARQLDYRGG